MPFLAHLTDEYRYLLAQPIDALYRLNRAERQEESAKASKGLEIKLRRNFQKATMNPIYMDGYDNRATYLHPARFLPGARIGVQHLWLEPRGAQESNEQSVAGCPAGHALEFFIPSIKRDSWRATTTWNLG